MWVHDFIKISFNSKISYYLQINQVMFMQSFVLILQHFVLFFQLLYLILQIIFNILMPLNFQSHISFLFLELLRKIFIHLVFHYNYVIQVVDLCLQFLNFFSHYLVFILKIFQLHYQLFKLI